MHSENLSSCGVFIPEGQFYIILYILIAKHICSLHRQLLIYEVAVWKRVRFLIIL